MVLAVSLLSRVWLRACHSARLPSTTGRPSARGRGNVPWDAAVVQDDAILTDDPAIGLGSHGDVVQGQGRWRVLTRPVAATVGRDQDCAARARGPSRGRRRGSLPRADRLWSRCYAAASRGRWLYAGWRLHRPQPSRWSCLASRGHKGSHLWGWSAGSRCRRRPWCGRARRHPPRRRARCVSMACTARRMPGDRKLLYPCLAAVGGAEDSSAVSALASIPPVTAKLGSEGHPPVTPINHVYGMWYSGDPLLA